MTRRGAADSFNEQPWEEAGMKLLRHTVPAGIGVAAVSLAMAALPQDALAQWEPQRPIEFVIQTSPGGGSDTYARLWIGIIERHNLSPVPITPVNMPGGAGAVAMTHLHAQRGDPHYITPTLNSLVTTPLQQEIPVMYPSEDLTPIVKMMMDPFWLVTHPENIGSWEEFLERCQNDRLTAVGTGARQEDEIQILLLQEAADCQPFRYVPAAGGGDVASQVAGQNADFNVNQPAEALPHYPERLIPIVQFVPERDPEFPDVPTHWELEIGTDKEVLPGTTYAEILDLDTGLHQMRGIIGPPDMPQEAIEWYEQLFRAVWETEEWQDFMKQGAMSPVFMTSDEYREWLIRFEDNHVHSMQDIFGWDLRPDLRVR
jgi:putative tricarboxylic transport membrane protein